MQQKKKPDNKQKNRNKNFKTYFSKVQRLLIEHSAMTPQCTTTTYNLHIKSEGESHTTKDGETP
jgi:hypothetical protein